MDIASPAGTRRDAARSREQPTFCGSARLDNDRLLHCLLHAVSKTDKLREIQHTDELSLPGKPRSATYRGTRPP